MTEGSFEQLPFLSASRLLSGFDATGFVTRFPTIYVTLINLAFSGFHELAYGKAVSKHQKK